MPDVPLLVASRYDDRQCLPIHVMARYRKWGRLSLRTTQITV